jgi:replicative DNA helicase
MDRSRILPHNLDSERIVIGSILSNINAFAEVNDILKADMFYDGFHRELYETIVETAKKGSIPDVVILAEKYHNEQKSVMRIVDISEMFSPDYYNHALNIQEKSIRRKLWKIGMQLSADIHSPSKETEELVHSLSKEIDAINQHASSSDIVHIRAAVKGVYQIIENNLHEKGMIGTDTGLSRLNEATGGLQKSDLIIIAGDSSSGKTSLALMMMFRAAAEGKGVAMYSMEMKKEQCTARLISMNCGVSSKDILMKKLDAELLPMVDKGAGIVERMPIYFDDNATSNIDKIIASIRSMKAKYDITGAVVDYLQILNVNDRNVNKEQAMGTVARRLKNLAMELNIWIIALSQFNRDGNNSIPNINRLRDSGQITEAADVVMLIYRPDGKSGKFYPEPFQSYSTKGTAMIDVAKGRNIGVHKFICGFEGHTTRFYELNGKNFATESNNNLPF